MNKGNFYILDEDKSLAQARIIELEKEILDFGPELHEALMDSTETGEDGTSALDVLRERRSVAEAELQGLKSMLQKASTAVPKPEKNRVSIGSYVKLSIRGRINRFFLAGHWSYRLGDEVNKAFVITCQSPIGKAILGRKVNDSVRLPHNGQLVEIAGIE